MNGVILLSAARKTAAPRMRIGLLRLTDGAPVIAAHEFGFFADEGLEVELTVEPSWANIADKLAFGLLDAAVIVPPLAFAIQLGLRGAAQPVFIPYTISTGGNAVTLARPLAREIEDLAARHGLSAVEALAARVRTRSVTLGVVHTYSTHNLLLRYWFAAAGIEAGRDVKLAIVPPARAVEALRSGEVAGFCAGAPWGEVARRGDVGTTVATSRDIWQNAPEKALAVRARWAEERPDALAGAMRALLRAVKFCGDPENASYTAALLSRRKYLDVDSHAILATLPGGTTPRNDGVRFRSVTTFPWRSQALWFLSEMRRWGLVEERVDLRKLAERVYRPDLYRSALSSLGEPVPAMDWKREGAHKDAWTVEASPAPIVMPADRFCDGVVFDPDALSPTAQPAKGALHNL